MFYNTLVL